MTAIESVHQDHVQEQQYQKSNDRSLLSHPKAQRCAANTGKRVQPIAKEDSTAQ